MPSTLRKKLEKIVPEHCIVASNTSGLRISEMTKGRSETLRKHFVVLHFFNPVRYMKLLEIVAGPDTDKGVLAHVVREAIVARLNIETYAVLLELERIDRAALLQLPRGSQEPDPPGGAG